MALTEESRREAMRLLGLDEDGPSLAQGTSEPKATIPTPVQTGIQFAPEGVDPHTMPVSDIEFTLDMLDSFPDLSGTNFKSASEFLFDQYRSRGRDRDRHALLHRRITEFISQVRRHRKSGGLIRERVVADAESRDLAQLLAAKGLTMQGLAALINAKEDS